MHAISSGVLRELRGADHIGRVDPVEPRQAAQHRVSLVVDADAGAGREVVGERPRRKSRCRRRDPGTAARADDRREGRRARRRRRGVEVRRRISLTTTATGRKQRRAVTILGGRGRTRSRRPPNWTRAGPGRRRPVRRADAASARNVPLLHPREIGQVWDRPSADGRSCCPVVDGSTSRDLSSLKMQR